MGGHQGRAQEGAKVARATARLPFSTEVAPPKEMCIFFLNSITAAELYVNAEYVREGRGRGGSG